MLKFYVIVKLFGRPRFFQMCSINTFDLTFQRFSSHRLTESRYTITFPGCVSTFFTTSSIEMASCDRLKPLGSPTSMMAMPVAVRPRPSNKLHRATHDMKT